MADMYDAPGPRNVQQEEAEYDPKQIMTDILLDEEWSEQLSARGLPPEDNTFALDLFDIFGDKSSLDDEEKEIIKILKGMGKYNPYEWTPSANIGHAENFMNDLLHVVSRWRDTKKYESSFGELTQGFTDWYPETYDPETEIGRAEIENIASKYLNPENQLQQGPDPNILHPVGKPGLNVNDLVKMVDTIRYGKGEKTGFPYYEDLGTMGMKYDDPTKGPSFTNPWGRSQTQEFLEAVNILNKMTKGALNK